MVSKKRESLHNSQKDKLLSASCIRCFFIYQKSVIMKKSEKNILHIEGENMTQEYKKISLPKLNNLEPNLESTALKLMEEAGELAQVIGKFRGLNEEVVHMEADEIFDKISMELLDVAQVAISMMFVLEDKYEIDIDEKVAHHISKLIKKGYMKGEE